MFDTQQVRRGLAILIVKAGESKNLEAARASNAVTMVKDQFAYRRLLLAETYQFYAGLLQHNRKVSHYELSGRDVKLLPDNLQSQWKAIWGKEYLGGDFINHTSKEAEEREMTRAKSNATTENWDNVIQVMENAALLAAAFKGPTISYSTWERLGLRTQVLSDAVATAQLADEESGK